MVVFAVKVLLITPSSIALRTDALIWVSTFSEVLMDFSFFLLDGHSHSKIFRTQPWLFD